MKALCLYRLLRPSWILKAAFVARPVQSTADRPAAAAGEWRNLFLRLNVSDLEPISTNEFAGNAPIRVPYIGYDMNSVLYEAEGNANYHALQLQARKRLSSGLQFTPSYTYSHALDDQSGLGLFFTGNKPLNPHSSYASTGFDRTHVSRPAAGCPSPGSFTRQLLVGWMHQKLLFASNSGVRLCLGQDHSYGLPLSVAEQLGIGGQPWRLAIASFLDGTYAADAPHFRPFPISLGTLTAGSVHTASPITSGRQLRKLTACHHVISEEFLNSAGDDPFDRVAKVEQYPRKLTDYLFSRYFWLHVELWNVSCQDVPPQKDELRIYDGHGTAKMDGFLLVERLAVSCTHTGDAQFGTHWMLSARENACER